MQEWPWSDAPSTLSDAQRKLVLGSSNGHHVFDDHAALLGGASAELATVWKLQLFCLPQQGAGAAEVARRLVALPELGGAKVLENTHFVELVPPATDKARALTLLSRHIGVPMERVVFFGDGGNDVEALRGVGLGIAMANGSDAAKEAATRTSRWEYTEDAVARELAQLAADGAFGTDVRLGGAAL